MTDKIENGGPAFPHVRKQVAQDIYQEVTGGGMSLRDWFAGQFLCGQLSFSPPDSFDKYNTPVEVSAAAYRFADAMLAARKAGA